MKHKTSGTPCPAEEDTSMRAGGEKPCPAEPRERCVAGSRPDEEQHEGDAGPAPRKAGSLPGSASMSATTPVCQEPGCEEQATYTRERYCVMHRRCLKCGEPGNGNAVPAPHREKACKPWGTCCTLESDFELEARRRRPTPATTSERQSGIEEELDSPGFVPKAAEELAARGFERVNAWNRSLHKAKLDAKVAEVMARGAERLANVELATSEVTLPPCNTANGQCVNHRACNDADKCLRPGKSARRSKSIPRDWNVRMPYEPLPRPRVVNVLRNLLDDAVGGPSSLTETHGSVIDGRNFLRDGGVDGPSRDDAPSDVRIQAEQAVRADTIRECVAVCRELARVQKKYPARQSAMSECARSIERLLPPERSAEPAKVASEATARDPVDAFDAAFAGTSWTSLDRAFRDGYEAGRDEPYEPTEALRRWNKDHGRSTDYPTDVPGWVAAAYVWDRREQYKPSSGTYEGLSQIIAGLCRGDHVEAWKRGELDDLKKNIDRVAGRKEGQSHE